MARKLTVIIDNRGEKKVLHALQRLLPNLQRMDIATGVFEIGSFLLLEGLWQGLERIRILMGDETTIKEYEKQINKKVYKLYGLKKEEIAIVENSGN